MNRTQAIELIRNTFEAPFERGRYIRFLRELLTGFDDAGARVNAGAYIPDKFQEYVEKLERVGKYVSGKNEILLFIVYLKKETSIERARTMQRNFVAHYLAQGGKDAALAAFVSTDPADWRFSLVKMEYRLEERDAKPKVREEFTPARRWSFLVGSSEKSHTAQSRFVPLLEDDQNQPTLAQLEEAFNIETVTKEFFETFRAIFQQAEESINPPWSAEQKRLYTQRFFNRLLFIAFLERKGWLKFGGRSDYLRALFADYYEKRRENNANFHRSRLNTLFFMGLNYPDGDKRADPDYRSILSRIGEVPYLNGGLFEQEEDDRDGPTFPDAVIAKILTDLVYQFNFTVNEATPLDVEVAVDPEMLGRIFEELVTGRHESGSYYTPKPVVQFMCRQALKGYLQTAVGQDSILSYAIERFVEQNDASALKNPEAVLNALRQVKVCDPACGSGAYLLGMLHELLELRECLFAARNLDARTVYERKLEIIQNNLYGVDKDPFAVNIARLRLWLSLIVDYEGAAPPPLPNLDFKIETGDALTAPDPSGGLQPDMFRDHQVREFVRLKNDFMSVHAGSEEKEKLKRQIAALKQQIAEWAHPRSAKFPSPDDSFDWQVEFAEVFAPALTPDLTPDPSPKGRGGQLPSPPGRRARDEGLPSPPERRAGDEGGFDIVLANPPYVRQELIKDLKPALKRVYGDLFSGTADLYVYFYLRAHQLLKKGGTACFISSNKWLRAGYGEKLRQHLLDAQAFRLVVDFGELPVFQTAATFPAIFLWQKQPRGETPTLWAVVKDLQQCYAEGIWAHVRRMAETVPAAQFGKDRPRLARAQTADLRARMEVSGVRLKEYVKGEIYRGIITGLNEAFLIDQAQYDELVSADPASAEILKPLIVGDDVRRYEIHYRNRYLIWTYIGVPITRYPAIFRHLKKFQPKAETRWDKGNHWWELRACDYYPVFEKPKIVYPEIARESRWVLDTCNYFPLKTAFSIASDDYFLLGILNSSSAWEYLKLICPVLGDENQGGRLTLQAIYVETIPIPDAPQSEREAVAHLARQAQRLHMQRRARVEQFLRQIGLNPAQSSSRNPLESPWTLAEEEFARRARGAGFIPHYRAAREETAALSAQIAGVESEIDARVKGLYGM